MRMSSLGATCAMNSKVGPDRLPGSIEGCDDEKASHAGPDCTHRPQKGDASRVNLHVETVSKTCRDARRSSLGMAQ